MSKQENGVFTPEKKQVPNEKNNKVLHDFL